MVPETFELFFKPLSDEALGVIISRYIEKTGHKPNRIAYTGKLPNLTKIDGIEFVETEFTVLVTHVAVYYEDSPLITE